MRHINSHEFGSFNVNLSGANKYMCVRVCVYVCVCVCVFPSTLKASLTETK